MDERKRRRERAAHSDPSQRESAAKEALRVNPLDKEALWVMHRLYPYDLGLAQQLVESMKRHAAITTIVDYSMSLSQMIEAAQLDYVNPGITDARFPIVGTGLKVISITLWHLTREDEKPIMAEAKERKLDQAKIEDILAIARVLNYKDASQRTSIVALGSPAAGESEVIVPEFLVQQERCLLLRFIESDRWDPESTLMRISRSTDSDW